MVLIPYNFTIEGLSFMAPFFNQPPSAWKVNQSIGYAELVVDAQQCFYHDVEQEEAKY